MTIVGKPTQNLARIENGPKLSSTVMVGDKNIMGGNESLLTVVPVGVPSGLIIIWFLSLFVFLISIQISF